MTDKKISELPEVFDLNVLDEPVFPVVNLDATYKFKFRRVVSANFGTTSFIGGGARTATVGEVAGGGFIARKFSSTGTMQITLPDAIDIAERSRQKGVVYDTNSADLGATYVLRIMNGSDDVLTLLPGAGVTIFNSTTIAAGKYRDYFVESYWELDVDGNITNAATELSGIGIGDF